MRAWLRALTGALLVLPLVVPAHAGPASALPADDYAIVDGAYQVHPGQDIQGALDLAADGAVKRVQVHEGVYRPRDFGPALIWFNARHEGVVLEAVGHVVLTAANPSLAASRVHQAVVSHVVYFGDGLSNATVMRGFEITGADNYITPADAQTIEPNTRIRRPLFFFTDGGGIKIFGRSYPTLESLYVHDNYATPCGGGISIQHVDESGRAPVSEQWVIIRDSVFESNVVGVTGSAVDLLPGSRAQILNSLFVNNVANTSIDAVSWLKGLDPYNGQNGSGALTIFPESKIVVRNSTFTGNWNGVDDRSLGGIYEDSIFWHNSRPGGIAPGSRYELDLIDGMGANGNFINGAVGDLKGTVSRVRNTFDAPDPQFDEHWVPRAPEYAAAGYRPVPNHPLALARAGVTNLVAGSR